MKRTLLFLYLIFLILFTINVMNRPDPQDIVLPDLQMYTASKSKYVLPKTPTFFIQNNTQKDVTIDNCEHLEIRQQGALRPLPEELCRSVEIPAGTSKAILGDNEASIDLFQKLGDTNLEFTFAYKQDDIDIRTTQEIVLAKPGAMRTFFRTVFYRPVYNFFVFLIEILPGYSLGLAIITITIIIRIILLVPQQKIMVSQQRMQAIQPKIKAIQKQYKNDQAQLGMKIMELYKKEKVNPFGSFVPLLMQIPILIVLYWTILGINDSSNHYHLYDFDFLQSFKQVVINGEFLGMDLLASGGIVGIILAIVVGLSQFIQMRLAQIRNEKKNPKEKKEKKKPKNPDEPEMPDMAQVGKIMVYFLPVMVAFFTYQFPAGVGLYWLVGTIFMTFQQIFVNKLVEKQKGKPEIIDKKGDKIA